MLHSKPISEKCLYNRFIFVLPCVHQQTVYMDNIENKLNVHFYKCLHTHISEKDATFDFIRWSSFSNLEFVLPQNLLARVCWSTFEELLFVGPDLQVSGACGRCKPKIDKLTCKKHLWHIFNFLV